MITYGLQPGADVTGQRLSLQGLSSRFEVRHRGQLLGPCALQVPGAHNVQNALAAVAVALDLEVPFPVVQSALAAFAGVERRFQLWSEVGGVLVVDDYGHHPAEIRATLAAAEPGSAGG